uniref:Photosystem II reaction center protein Z n=3 Tax=Zamiaceae TaxID=3298 RepID=A0A0H5BFS7_LEPPR|nr:photosystem II protein Z [Lepidozamia peroffskyana]BAR93719.1 photosystem II protein Z [Lepidozamia peroffskyana]
MTIAFQLAVFALIAISFLLVIGVPVVLASPDGWSSSKNVIFSGASLWIGSVLLVGILNSFISQICWKCFGLEFPHPTYLRGHSSSEGHLVEVSRNKIKVFEGGVISLECNILP